MASAAAIAAAPQAPVVAEETPALRALLAGLSGEQRAVVESELGNLRVLAGPGSGKTRVLVARIAHLARRHNAPLKGILAITFTTKVCGFACVWVVGRGLMRACACLRWPACCRPLS